MQILLNGKVVASHSPAAPLFSTGASAPEMRQSVGGWSVQNRQGYTKPLPRFEWDEESSLLTFRSTRRRLSFILSEHEGAAELRLVDASQDFGRVILHLRGSEDAAVLGGGDAGRGDLRGKKLLLWGLESGGYGGSNAFEALRSRERRSEDGSAAPQAFFHDDEGFYLALKHPGGVSVEVSKNGHRDFEMWGLPESIYLGYETDTAKRQGRVSLLGAERKMPPRWSIEGVTIGVSGGEEQLLLSIDSAVRGGLRPTAVYIRDWSGVSGGGEPFEDWSPSVALYPRMTEILDRLRARGIQGIARVAPLLSVDGEGFSEAAREGFLLTDEDGQPSLTDRGGMVAHLDLENPEAREWAAERLKKNVFGAGFAAVQAECAEAKPSDALTVGGKAFLFHNRRAARWLEICRSAAEKSKGTVFASSGAALGLAPMAEVSGVGADWELGLGLKSVLEGILGLSAVGVGAVYCDAGPQFHRVPQDLRGRQLVRWAELAAFMPHFRLPVPGDDFHGLEQSDRAIISRMAQLHALLLPYIAVLLKEYSKGGFSPIRHTLDEYPELKGQSLDGQFLLGRDLVVAPVCDLEQDSAEVVLPEGQWIRLFGGGDYIGGRHRVETLPGNPAVFFRGDGEHSGFFRSMAAELE